LLLKPTSTIKRETYFLLLIKILLDPEELPGEPFPPLKRKRNKRDPRTLVSSEPINPRLRVNLTSSGMKSSTLLTANLLRMPLTLKL
jgi:hypothetical protein